LLNSHLRTSPAHLYRLELSDALLSAAFGPPARKETIKFLSQDWKSQAQIDSLCLEGFRLDAAFTNRVKPPFYVPLPDRVSGTGGRMFRVRRT